MKAMCARFGVTPRTLRYYEFLELLAPERVGRSRIYGPREVARLTLILRGRRFGFALEEIRQWLLMYQQDGPRPQLQTWIASADRQIVDLERQSHELQAIIAELKSLRAAAARDLAGEPPQT